MSLESIRENMGSQLRAQRKRRKWNQKILSENSGVAEKTIAQIENYKGNPTIKTLYKLAKIFEIDISSLCKDERGKK